VKRMLQKVEDNLRKMRKRVEGLTPENLAVLLQLQNGSHIQKKDDVELEEE
jgi:hypothetical protein